MIFFYSANEVITVKDDPVGRRQVIVRNLKSLKYFKWKSRDHKIRDGIKSSQAEFLGAEKYPFHFRPSKRSQDTGIATK